MKDVFTLFMVEAFIKRIFVLWNVSTTIICTQHRDSIGSKIKPNSNVGQRNGDE